MSHEQDDRKGSSRSKDDNAFITTAEAAAMLRLSPRTLEKMRQRGEGPEYFKIQNRTWYTREKVLAHIASTLRKSTCDPPKANNETSPTTPDNAAGPGKPDQTQRPDSP